jgi:hypothetical protein
MKTEFNLSDKIFSTKSEPYAEVINIKDVRKFIKLLKKEYSTNFNITWEEIIDKLAGSKLIDLEEKE